MIKIYKLTLLIAAMLIFSLGCSPKSDNQQPPLESRTTMPSSVKTHFDTFFSIPDEEHFKAFVSVAKLSPDPTMQTVVDYAEYSKRLTPVDDPTVNSVELNSRLQGRPAGDFYLIEQMVSRHTNPWRRWTMARFLGDFGGQQSALALNTLLNDTDEAVRKHAREAINAISTRRKVPSTK